jgi:uncharacterized protein YqgC (DUF456 family)
MEWLLIIIGFLLNGLGILGCVVPGLPGPILSWASLLVFLLIPGADIGWLTLTFTGVIIAIITLLDYYIPILGAKKFGSTRQGMIGGTIGIVVGLFVLPPIGIIIGPLAGTIIGDLMAGKDLDAAFKSGMGALLGFVAGTLIKLGYCIGVLVLFSVKGGSILWDRVHGLIGF